MNLNKMDKILEWIHERKMVRLEFQKKCFDRRQEVRKKKLEMKLIRFPTTTKIIMFFIFLNCTAVELFSMVAMWRFADLSSLYALITAVVTETMAFAVYALKAYHETKQEELMKFEHEKMHNNMSGEN